MAQYIIGQNIIITGILYKEEYEIEKGSFKMLENGCYSFNEIDQKTKAFIPHYRRLKYFEKIKIIPILGGN